jgi:hypothetical protein
MESPSNGLVDRSKGRLMIAGDDELELRPVFEKVLPHEPGRNCVAAGKLLDPTLSPASALFCFGRSDEAGAAKAGQICRMSVGVARCEGLDWRRLVIVAEYACDC